MSPTEMTTDKRRNPLLSYTPTTIDSWENWMNAWEKAKYAEYRHELLHIGLDLQLKNEQEVIPFYLRVADGHMLRSLQPSVNDFGKSHWPGDFREKSNGEIRKILAEKAFSVLVTKFFTSRPAGRGDIPGWVHFNMLGTVLEDVVWFLRCEQRVFDHFENWGPRNFRVNRLHSPAEERAAQVMTEFVVYLVKLAFNRPFFDNVVGRVISHPDLRELAHDQLIALRPQLIEPLAYIGRLDLLLEYGVEIDDAWLESLSQLAEISPNWSISDSVCSHNKTAMALQSLLTIQRGQEVSAAEQAARDARTRAEELRSSMQ